MKSSITAKIRSNKLSSGKFSTVLDKKEGHFELKKHINLCFEVAFSFTSLLKMTFFS